MSARELLGEAQDGVGWWGRLLGELDYAGGFPLNANPNGLVSFLLVKAGAGTLFGFSGFSNRAGQQFIHVFDANALPADGAVPALPISVPASSNFSADFGTWGRSFTRGILLCNSTTLATKTIGAADCWFDAQYV